MYFCLKRGVLDHWATVQFFFSLAWAWWLLMHWLQLQFTPCEALPSVWISFAWQYSQACGHPCCLCTFSYPISSFQSTLHLICFDTALLTSWNMDPITTPPPPPPTLPHHRKKLSNFYFCAIQVCYTQVSEPAQATCSITLSSTRTRHFHTLLCAHNPTKDWL